VDELRLLKITMPWLSGVAAWPPVLCQRDGCVNVGKCQAVEVGSLCQIIFIHTAHFFIDYWVTQVLLLQAVFFTRKDALVSCKKPLK